jgi:transposase-like protein
MRINDIRNYMQLRYGYYPSAALTHLWINKYTDIAHKMIKDNNPQVSDMWIAGEMITRLGKRRFWIYEIIDEETHYSLASLITLRTPGVIKTLIQRASEVARRMPKRVMVYIPLSGFNAMEKGSGYVSEHVPVETFATLNRIGIISAANIYRIRNLNFLRTPKTANKFYNGLSIHYNYFATNEKLNGKTPAEAAQIKYPFHSWKDLIEQHGRLHTG